ncbi:MULTISPECIES: hypothetical protein [Chelativorans]|jgi:hypothetical protein|uniref:hypothetical protein n=1 Tax=Chelativorans TaxID=449972 RepID=UPI00003A30D5|nr:MULTISPECIES: hypothetical protein [Chelativorans]
MAEWNVPAGDGIADTVKVEPTVNIVCCRDFSGNQFIDTGDTVVDGRASMQDTNRE